MFILSTYKQLDHLLTYVIMQLAQQLAMLLTLPLKRQNQLHRLHSQQKQLDHWLRVVGSMARLSRQWACLWVKIGVSVLNILFSLSITKV